MDPFNMQLNSAQTNYFNGLGVTKRFNPYNSHNAVFTVNVEKRVANNHTFNFPTQMTNVLKCLDVINAQRAI
jgi:hypothetical protein